MAELVDALGSGSSEGFLVRVRISPSAPLDKQASVIAEAFLFGASALRSNPIIYTALRQLQIPYVQSYDSFGIGGIPPGSPDSFKEKSLSVLCASSVAGGEINQALSGPLACHPF